MFGVITVANWLRNDAAALVLAITSGTVVIWRFGSDVQSWRKSRQERKQGRPPPEDAWFLTRVEYSQFARRMASAVEGWESLQDRKAKLDKRIENGQITSETAARYLAAHRRLLIEGLGYNRPTLWPERIVVSALLPLLASSAARSSSKTRPTLNALASTEDDQAEQVRTSANW